MKYWKGGRHWLHRHLKGQYNIQMLSTIRCIRHVKHYQQNTHSDNTWLDEERFKPNLDFGIWSVFFLANSRFDIARKKYNNKCNADCWCTVRCVSLFNILKPGDSYKPRYSARYLWQLPYKITQDCCIKSNMHVCIITYGYKCSLAITLDSKSKVWYDPELQYVIQSCEKLTVLSMMRPCNRRSYVPVSYTAFCCKPILLIYRRSHCLYIRGSTTPMCLDIDRKHLDDLTIMLFLEWYWIHAVLCILLYHALQ